MELFRLLRRCRHHQRGQAQLAMDAGDQIGRGGIEHHHPLLPAPPQPLHHLAVARHLIDQHKQ